MYDSLKPLIVKLPNHLEQEWLEKWLKAYAAKKPIGLPVEKFVFPTEFMKKANLALLDIPWGETITYQELADRIGCKSARAVGTAMAKNPQCYTVSFALPPCSAKSRRCCGSCLWVRPKSPIITV